MKAEIKGNRKRGRIQQKEKAHTQLERILYKGPCVFGWATKRWSSQRLIDEDGE
jgi:hypothetical protein